MTKTIKYLSAVLLAVILLVTSPMAVMATVAEAQQAPAVAVQQSDPVTRGQFAALISDAFQLPPAEGYPSFPDVPADHPFAAAIMNVNAFGFMVGSSTGNFYPDSIISGAEAAVLINNIIGFDGSRVPQATGLSIPEWAVPAASVLLDLTMVDARLIERPELNLGEAVQLIGAVALALVIAPGTPYALQQVDLRDNFFSYVNRQFLATGVMHPGSIAAGSFNDVAMLVRTQQETILSEILNNPNLAPDSDEWRIRELFNMFLDNETRIASMSMLEPYFDAIRNAGSIDELLGVARRYSAYLNLMPFYSMGFTRDVRVDATQWAAFIMAAPLSMGSRDLYINDPSLAVLHTAYIDLTATMLMHIGETENLEERAAAVFAIEQARAARMLPAEAYADIQALYTTVTWDEVMQASSVTQSLTFDEELFARAQVLNVYSPYLDYITFINSLYVEENLQALKDAALLNIFMTLLPVLDDEFSGLTNELMSIMFGQPMGGGMTIVDRAQQFVTSVMWRTFSRAYYQRFSSPELKRDVTEMTEDIRAVMRDMINDIPWMTYETRATSIEKLDAVTAFIAFPDEPVHELAFQIRPQSEGGNLIEFMESMARLNNEMWLDLLDGPANISLWEGMPTSTVNAGYSPMENAIIIPAGILQYPFYCITSTREQNLGAIGAVIAHEFVHAFDPMGSQFDKYGTMTNWWTETDVAAFAERNARVISILNSIEFAGMNLNGALNVNEAVTDLGAMEVAMTVASRMPDADVALVLEAWAIMWQSRMTPEVAHFMMMNAPHLPAKLRVNFILAQLDEFREVFGIVEGDGMYIPEEYRISFWR